MDSIPRIKQLNQLQNGEVKLGPRVKQVFDYIFENPTATKTQIAKHFGISIPRVSQITRSKRFIAAMPLAARRRYSSNIPRALKAQEQLIDQTENLMVRDKASARVLESENILNSTPNVQINVYQSMQTDDLRRVISEAKPAASDVVDAELADDTEPT